VGHLVRETGLALMQTVMEEEVRHLAGERHQQHEGRCAHSWGKEDGYCVVNRQKVPIRKTRLRNAPAKAEPQQNRHALLRYANRLRYLRLSEGRLRSA
jgi:hypothetical protein